MDKTKSLSQAIILTLCYSDVFNYPLTTSEIHNFLIWRSNGRPPSYNHIFKILQSQQGIERKGDYFTLRGRINLIKVRKQRKKWSKQKLVLAKRVGKWLKLIPTLQAVAVTGALAMENAQKNDDIDLMIITKTNRLWLSRLLILGMVSLIAKRRKATDIKISHKNFKDHICINLFLDESVLQVPKNKRNLYTAHEVAQAKFLWSRNKIKEKFFSQNSWILNYLPNIRIPKKKKKTIKQFNDGIIGNFIENLAFKAQLNYMKKRKTRELVSPHFAFFHPRSTDKIIMNKYTLRLNRYKKEVMK